MNRRRLVLLALPLLPLACKKTGSLNVASQQSLDVLRGDTASQRTDSVSDTSRTLVVPIASGPPRPVTFTGRDSAISGPDSLVTGAFEMRYVNNGRRVQELRFLRLPNEAAPSAAIAYIRERSQLPPGLGAQGGVGPLLPGRSMMVVQTLRPGNYLVVSTILGADGRPSFLSGAMRVLSVTGDAPARVQPPLIKAPSAMVTSDGSWRFGRTLLRGDDRSLMVEGRNRRTDHPRGSSIIMLEHFGSPTHDAVIIKSGRPHDMRDYVAWLEGSRADPPQIVGGVPGLIPQMRAYIHLDLTPGSYIIFCPRPRGGGQSLGYELGEYDQFVVK